MITTLLTPVTSDLSDDQSKRFVFTIPEIAGYLELTEREVRSKAKRFNWQLTGERVQGGGNKYDAETIRFYKSDEKDAVAKFKIKNAAIEEIRKKNGHIHQAGLEQQLFTLIEISARTDDSSQELPEHPNPSRVYHSPAAQAGADAARKLRETEALAVEDIRQRKIQYLAMFNSLTESAQLAGKAKQTLLVACKSFLDEGGFVGRVKKGQQRWSTNGLQAFCQAFIDGTLELPEDITAVFIRKGKRSLTPASMLNFRNAYEEQGLYGLADHYASKAGSTSLPVEKQKFIEAMLYDFPGTSVKNIYRGMKARFKGDALPTIHSVRRFISRWLVANKEAYLKVTYPDAWRSKYQSAQGDADGNINGLNERFECDSTPADILCVDGRCCIIGVIDVWSRRLKLHVSPTSRATAIAALLRWVVLHWGIPGEWRTDNGSDYTANYMEDVLHALNIYHYLCPPFTPENKPFIERALGAFNHSLLELLYGFIGHNVTERKAIESRQSFAKRLMTPGEVIEAKMTRAELQKFCDDYTNKVYATEAHGALSGMSPAEKVRSWTGPVAKITDARALDILLLPTPGGDGFRTITKKGIVATFFGVKLRYVSAHFAGHYGKRVQVKVDETNLAYAYIFQEDRQFLCVAEDPALSGINLQALATHAKKRQNKLNAEVTQEMRRNARQQDTKGIVHEIMQVQGEQAAKILEMPKKSAEYSTQALEEAALAVEERDRKTAFVGGTPITEEQQKVAEELINKKALPAQPQTEIEKFFALEKKWKDGSATAEEAAFCETFEYNLYNPAKLKRVV